jgi:hypothetical protein
VRSVGTYKRPARKPAPCISVTRNSVTGYLEATWFAWDHNRVVENLGSMWRTAVGTSANFTGAHALRFTLSWIRTKYLMFLVEGG